VALILATASDGGNLSADAASDAPSPAAAAAPAARARRALYLITADGDDWGALPPPTSAEQLAARRAEAAHGISLLAAAAPGRHGSVELAAVVGRDRPLSPHAEPEFARAVWLAGVAVAGGDGGGSGGNGDGDGDGGSDGDGDVGGSGDDGSGSSSSSGSCSDEAAIQSWQNAPQLSNSSAASAAPPPASPGGGATLLASRMLTMSGVRGLQELPYRLG
jgi:hypothetical protein